jgi:hypothetical protein
MENANHDNVATQLTHYETDSFAIQNQASHYVESNVTGRKAAEFPTPPLIVQGTTNKAPGIPMECVQESGSIDENTQSGRRMIA